MQISYYIISRKMAAILLQAMTCEHQYESSSKTEARKLKFIRYFITPLPFI